MEEEAYELNLTIRYGKSSCSNLKEAKLWFKMMSRGKLLTLLGDIHPLPADEAATRKQPFRSSTERSFKNGYKYWLANGEEG